MDEEDATEFTGGRLEMLLGVEFLEGSAEGWRCQRWVRMV